eukprot:5791394-Alexandrium_andersonii.AAC.1
MQGSLRAPGLLRLLALLPRGQRGRDVLQVGRRSAAPRPVRLREQHARRVQVVVGPGAAAPEAPRGAVHEAEAPRGAVHRAGRPRTQQPTPWPSESRGATEGRWVGRESRGGLAELLPRAAAPRRGLLDLRAPALSRGLPTPARLRGRRTAAGCRWRAAAALP